MNDPTTTTTSDAATTGFGPSTLRVEADPGDGLGTVTISRTYAASAELLFECMTTAEHLTHFWGPPGISTPIENITIELHVGGRFETIMVNEANGDHYPMIGVFTEVDPPHRMSWRESGAADGMSNELTFHDLGDGRCEVTTVQRNVPAMYRSPEASAGMAASFERCDAYLATLTRG